MHLHVIGQGLKTVGETGRNVELALVPGRKLKPLPLPIGGRVRADVHDHIKDRAPHAADQFYLLMRWLLEVQPAKRSTLLGEREAMLQERCFEAFI